MARKKLTREQVEEIVREAGEKGERPDLTDTDLSEVDLSRADLSGANLSRADLTLTKLDSTNFSNTIIADTLFARVDLSQAKGLTDIDYQGFSIIDINTIYQSKDKIPKAFLEGAGVHPDIIRWQHSLHTRPLVAWFNKVKQRPLESLIILVWEGIIGGAIGAISGVINAALLGLVISIIASAYNHYISGLGSLILLGGIIGLLTGFITRLLCPMTDSSLYGGWEWAIIGALAGLSLLLIEGYNNFGGVSVYSFPVTFLVVGIIAYLTLFAIPSAVVAYFTITHQSSIARSRYITVTSLAIYVVAIVLMTVVVYGGLEIVM